MILGRQVLFIHEPLIETRTRRTTKYYRGRREGIAIGTEGIRNAVSNIDSRHARKGINEDCTPVLVMWRFGQVDRFWVRVPWEGPKVLFYLRQGPVSLHITNDSDYRVVGSVVRSEELAHILQRGVVEIVQ